MNRSETTRSRVVALAAITALLLADAGNAEGIGELEGGSDIITPAAAPTSRGQLTAVNARATVTAETITTTVRNRGFPDYSATYGAVCKQLVYGTIDASGALLNVSALACVPKKAAGATSPVLSFSHGTIVSDTDTPSAKGSFPYYMAQGAAGLGYVTVMPDYIGYGAAKDRLHPYLHAQTLAAATVDAVRATRRYLKNSGIATNGKLFLSGYSEGGYAAFAAQRSMEQEFPGEFTVTASAPGAGPYSLLQTVNDMIAKTTLPSGTQAAFVVTAYDATYDPVSRLSDYFRAPYDANAAFAFDGTRTSAQVNALFTKTTAKLFDQPFLDEFRGDGETELKGWLAENNLHDTWIPLARTRLFHGAQDTLVPIANAQAVDAHAGTAADVAVVKCNAGTGVATTHDNCSKPYWIYIFNFFGSLNPGL